MISRRCDPRFNERRRSGRALAIQPTYSHIRIYHGEEAVPVRMGFRVANPLGGSLPCRLKKRVWLI
jgi:hypothetical protein